MNDDELNTSEEEAMAALPRERAPSEFLEERVVRALRNQGVLETRKRRFLEVTSFRLAGAVAACIVLLIGGFALGRWTDSLRLVRTDTLPLEAGEASVAASLQRAGTAYVLALETLASMPEVARGDDMRQGREVALVTLYTAADQMARIVPRDLLARQLLQVIEPGRGTRIGGRAGKDGTRVIWF
jgi:hypothetical protein